jgi:hypothetical protein
MSEDNIELLRRAYDALNRHDVDAMVALSDPEMEFRPLLLAIEGAGPLRGHESLRCWWQDLLGLFPDWGIEINEVRQVGCLTLARVKSHGSSRDSDAVINQQFWQVTEWRDGKALWWHNFLTEAEAVEAAETRAQRVG